MLCQRKNLLHKKGSTLTVLEIDVFYVRSQSGSEVEPGGIGSGSVYGPLMRTGKSL